MESRMPGNWHVRFGEGHGETDCRKAARRSVPTPQCLYIGMSTKVSAETMWKVAGLVLSLGGVIAGIVSFLLNLLLRH